MTHLQSASVICSPGMPDSVSHVFGGAHPVAFCIQVATCLPTWSNSRVLRC